VGFDKTSSSHHSSILHPMGTQISTTLRVGLIWNISSRTRGMLPLLALKANNLSSPNNNYGKTATNPNHLPVFKGLDVMLSLRKWPINRRRSHGRSNVRCTIVWSEETSDMAAAPMYST
jgi:hypothetical protein